MGLKRCKVLTAWFLSDQFFNPCYSQVVDSMKAVFNCFLIDTASFDCEFLSGFFLR